MKFDVIRTCEYDVTMFPAIPNTDQLLLMRRFIGCYCCWTCKALFAHRILIDIPAWTSQTCGRTENHGKCFLAPLPFLEVPKSRPDSGPPKMARCVSTEAARSPNFGPQMRSFFQIKNSKKCKQGRADRNKFSQYQCPVSATV